MKKSYLSTIKWAVIMCLCVSLSHLFAQEEHSHAADEALTDGHNMQVGVFAVYAESQKYELTLKYGELKPGQPGDLTLYIAEYATNRPVSDAELKLTVQEDPSIALETEGVEPGVYHIHGKFPSAKSYALTVNLNSKALGPDLLLLSQIEVGKEPPQAAEALVDNDVKANSDWWKFALVFFGGLGMGYLFLRRRPKVAVAILVVVGLHGWLEEARAHGGHDDNKEATAGNQVFIPKETQFLFSVTTQSLAAGDFQPSVELFGNVIPSPGGYANIATPQTGKITSLRVTPGQKVSSGQVLAVVQPSASLSEQVGVATETGRLKADLKTAQAELNAAEKELNRMRAISDIAAKKEVQAAEARYNAAKANYEALSSVASGSVISSGGSLTLKSPVSGTVGQFALAPGAEIMAGTTLFSITNLDKVFVEAQVYDSDADFVRDASKYTVTCTNNNHKTAQVRIVSAALEVNPSNQSQKVIFELINPDGEFKIGEFVTLHAYQQKSDKTIFVPNSALSEISGKPVLFVKDNPETYSVRYISTGEDNGTHTVVLNGMKEKDRFVIEGTYQVKMMMLNQ